MDIDKARDLVREAMTDLGEPYAEAAQVLLDDHATLQNATSSVRIGAREREVLAFMRTVPGIPMSPEAVRVAISLTHSPAELMARLAQKGLLRRPTKSAIYVWTTDLGSDDGA